jgi:DNA repair exonuclease SbcCD ATPase subunit
MLEKDDVSVYAESIKMLADPEKSPLIKVDPVKLAQDKAAKKNYDRWRKTVTQKMHDVAEANRLENETKQLSKSVKDLEIEITDLSSSLANIDSEKEAVQKEECELKKLLDASKRWSETARAIESKKSRISQKNEDLTLSMTASTIDTRDVRTVERELDEKREEKDLYMSKIARLNNELNALNTRITNFTASVSFVCGHGAILTLLFTLCLPQATRMEQRVKELETKFSKEQKDVIRKNELNEKIRQLQDEDKKVSIVPRLAMFGERYLLKNIKINLLNFCSLEINLLSCDQSNVPRKARNRGSASMHRKKKSGYQAISAVSRGK